MAALRMYQLVIGWLFTDNNRKKPVQLLKSRSIDCIRKRRACLSLIDVCPAERIYSWQNFHQTDFEFAPVSHHLLCQT